MSIVEIIPKMSEIDKTLALANEYGAAFEYNEFFNPSVLDDKRKIKEIIKFYKSLGRDTSQDTLHGAFLDITVHSADKSIRKASDYRVRQCMDIAEKLGVRGVIFHTNYIANFIDSAYRENWLKTNVDYFTRVASDYPNTQIYMENMFDQAPELIARFGKETAAVPNLSLCLDVAHAHISTVPIYQWMQIMGPYVSHMHFNDNDSISDQHDAIGSGSIWWSQLSDDLAKFGIAEREPSVLVEISDVEKQRASLAYMKENRIYPFV